MRLANKLADQRRAKLAARLDPADRPWALAPLKNKRAPLFWIALDRLEKLGLGKSPWRAAGVMTAATPPKR